MKIQAVHRKTSDNTFPLAGFTVYEFDGDGFGHVSATYLDGDWELAGNNLNKALKNLVIRLIAEKKLKLNSVTKHIAVTSDLSDKQGLAFYMNVEQSGLT